MPYGQWHDVLGFACHALHSPLGLRHIRPARRFSPDPRWRSRVGIRVVEALRDSSFVNPLARLAGIPDRV